MKEIWKNVDGYESKYQISNKGLVKSFKQRTSGKLLKQKPLSFLKNYSIEFKRKEK